MSWYNPFSWGDESDSSKQKRADLNQQGELASGFAQFGENGYGAMTNESNDAREALRRAAMGKDSMAAEQLRQGLGQQLSMQRSFAASASPANAPMAARTAAIQMGRASAGMAGNAAMAGIAERQQAQQALMDAILKQRQQDMQVGLGSRQNAISGYGGVTPDKSFIDKWGNAITAGASIAAK